MKLKHSSLSQWPENSALESGVSGKLCTIVINVFSYFRLHQKFIKCTSSNDEIEWESNGFADQNL